MYRNWKSELRDIDDLVFCSNLTWARTLQRIYAFIESKIQICGWYQCMDNTNSRCQLFKNQLGLLLDSFEVCSKVTKSVLGLTHFL